ncbi:MAG: DUF2148 domain-containing protein [Eubacteriaceae bacterium]|nr:DUF2148 domain-containing protein [Eubacteriaceae bacterium]
MHINSKEAEKQAIANAAFAMCAAIRTAPKARGIDNLDSAVLFGDDKSRISSHMRSIAQSLGDDGEIFARDAANVDTADALLLVGAQKKTRGLDSLCNECGYHSCQACESAGATCVFTSIDLGIALGSAVSLAADLRIDTRIMYTVGKAAAALDILGVFSLVLGISMSVSGKSPFFDRQ